MQGVLRHLAAAGVSCPVRAMVDGTGNLQLHRERKRRIRTMPPAQYLQYVVFPQRSNSPVESRFKMFPYPCGRRIPPKPLWNRTARKPAALHSVSGGLNSGTGNDGILLCPNLHTGVFHHFAPRTTDDIHHTDRLFQRWNHPASIFSGENAAVHGTLAFCGYSERPAAHL